MNNPISVTIKNNLDKSRNIRWTAKYPVTLPANGEVEIPYEPWSCADRNQRQAILAECQGKFVSFTLHVADVEGKIVDVAYDPSTMLQPRTSEPAKPAEEAVKPAAVEVKVDNDHPHIITAGVGEALKNMGFQATEVKPPAQKDPKGEHDGAFIVEKSEAKGLTTTEVLAEKKEDEAPADETKAEFDKAVEEKRWNDALQILVGKFGEDKVTFTTRVIMSMKDYDAIVAKYKLS